MKTSRICCALALSPLVFCMTNVTVDISDPSIVRTGSWGAATNCGSVSEDGSVTLTFTGVAIYFIGDTNTQGGLFQATLDGQASPQIDRGRANVPVACGVTLFQMTGLQNEQHKITIALVGPSPGPGFTGRPNIVVQSLVYTKLDPTDLPASSSASSTSSASPTSNGATSEPTSPATSLNPSSTLSPQSAAATPSHKKTGVIVGSVLGALGGLALLAGLAALANHLMHQPPSPGAHPGLDHDFVFFVPPLGGGKKDLAPTQITLTLTPKDALEKEGAPKIAWEVFHIGGENRKFQCKLPFDLAFGSVLQHDTGHNTYPFHRFCPPGYSVAVSQRNGRDIWKKPGRQSDVTERIKATNASGVPKTFALGSFHKGLQPPFQPFYLVPGIKHEGDYLDPPDLVLQAYRTQGCEKGQTIAPDKLSENLYHGLVRSLEKVTTWRVRPQGDHGLKLEIVKNDTPMEEKESNDLPSTV